MDSAIKHIFSSISSESVSDEDARQGPVDIVVQLTNGEQYLASFFSYDKIAELHREHQLNGEYLNGQYFWRKYMVLVEDCRLPAVERIVDHLLEEGEFEEIFEKVSGIKSGNNEGTH